MANDKHDLDHFDSLLDAVTDPEREAIAAKAKTEAQADDPQLPTRPEGMSRAHFIESGGFTRLTLLLLASDYARRLDRFDSLPVLPNQPLGTDPSRLILHVEELKKRVTELVDATGRRSVEPCKKCEQLQLCYDDSIKSGDAWEQQSNTWEKRRNNAEKAAKAYQFSADENLKYLKLEKQKNATIQEELIEFREELDRNRECLNDIINQAERDDGVEVVETTSGHVCKAPRNDDEDPELLTTDERGLTTDERGVLHNPGYPPLMPVRVLTEVNYQHARHCVRCFPELLAMCKAALDESINVCTEGDGDGLSEAMDRRLMAIIEKAEVTP